MAISSPFWGYKLLRTGKWRTDWAGRFGSVPSEAVKQPGDDRPTVLIHAVSVGEVNAIREMVKLIEAIPEDQQPWRLVICSTTNTGVARAKQLFEPRHVVIRFPLDFSFAVGKTLDAVQPDAVALVELEVWPNFMEGCAKRGIPVAVINGRLSARSYSRYQKVRSLLHSTFARLTSAAVQNEDYAQRFRGMGVPADRVRVTDSMKWDTARIEDHVEGSDELAREMGIDTSRPVIVAGSTGPGEEQLLIETCPAEAQLVLVPRKPERFEEVAAMAAGHGPVVRRTQHPAGGERTPDDTRLFLLDTMGELRKAYALADVVLVGRSFLGLYGSDLIEPIALGKPTCIGPHHSDFQDIVDAFRADEGVIVTDKPGQMAAELLADRGKAAELGQRGRAVIERHQGASARHVELLRDIMRGCSTPGAASA